jgi:predicted transcriptional regulator
MDTKVPTAEPRLSFVEEGRRRLTLEAMDDIDHGRVMKHQAVQAWADGLRENYLKTGR